MRDAYLRLGPGVVIIGVLQNTIGSAYIEGYNQLRDKQLLRLK